MTVRTLSGATVTLVGRGADYFDGDAIIPSFVDAAGTEYFLTVNANRPEGELPAIIGGVLVVGGADFVLSFEVDSSRFILVNNPSSEYNSTSALVFAKRCGIEVSLAGLVLFDGVDKFHLVNQPLTCIDSAVRLTDNADDAYAAFVDPGWNGASSAYVGCNFQPVDTISGGYIEADFLDNLWSEDAIERKNAHNAWVFVLAGVPESVFAT